MLNDGTLAGKRILIVGINYWPEETGNAPYTTKIAEHLADLGNEVYVIAGMPYYPAWDVAAGYEHVLRSAEVRNGVQIYRYRQYVPGNQSAIKRLVFEGTFLLNAFGAWKLPAPDIILGVLPSLSDGMLCVCASHWYKVPFGLLVQDLSGQAAAQSGIKGGKAVAGVTRKTEGWVCRKASSIAIVAEGFRHNLLAMGVAPQRISRVRNWTHVGVATCPPNEARTGLGLPLDKTVVLHAGNMGLKQGLENVIDAARLAEATSPHLVFAMMGGGNQKEVLKERAKALTNVKWLPPQSEEEFPNALAAADILLVNQRKSVVDMSLPGKLTSYFSSGRPVVAAVNPTSETRYEVEAANGGVVIDSGDPGLLVETLDSLASDPHLMKELGLNGLAYQQEHLTPTAALATIVRFIESINPQPQEMHRYDNLPDARRRNRRRWIHRTSSRVISQGQRLLGPRRGYQRAGIHKE